MCPQCKEILEIWGKGIKTPEDTKLLSHEVPQRFTKVFRYFDDDAQTMVQLMECKYCGQTCHVPH